MITCTKTFDNLPFAHRQHLHDGHCSLIHGHNWAFTFEFAAHELDANGFVIDFGRLKWMRAELEEMFDHTLVLNESDPALVHLKEALAPAFAKIVTVPNCGAEGLGVLLMAKFTKMLDDATEGRVFVQSIIVHEDARNSAKVSIR